MGSFFVSLFILKIGVNFVNVVKLCPIFSSTSEETEDEDLPSSPASSSTSSTWLGNVTLAWQEKLFSPSEENYYRKAKEEDFQGNVLKKKFFRDVQDAKKRSKTLAQQIFTCLNGELYQHDEVKSRISLTFFQLCNTFHKFCNLCNMPKCMKTILS